MSWWNDHGPKIVNGISVATAAVASVDPSLLPPTVLSYVVAINAILNILHNVQHNAVAPMPPKP